FDNRNAVLGRGKPIRPTANGLFKLVFRSDMAELVTPHGIGAAQEKPVEEGHSGGIAVGFHHPGAGAQLQYVSLKKSLEVPLRIQLKFVEIRVAPQRSASDADAQGGALAAVGQQAAPARIKGE